MKRLTLLLLCLISSIAHAMHLPRCVHFNRMGILRSSPTSLTVASRSPLLSSQLAQARCTVRASRRLIANVPISGNQQLQEINEKMRDARIKKLVAKARSIGWNASNTLIIPPLIVPTAAAYYLSGAAGLVGLLFAPEWILHGDFACLSIHTIVAPSVFLASRAALGAEEKLADFIAKKCDDNDKKVTELKNLVEELRKQRKELSEKEQL